MALEDPALDPADWHSRTVTSAEVARAAGVSRAAVSRAFTPGASVSAAMRAKVDAAATLLGYRPNSLARGLITGRSGIVGWVGSTAGVPFYDRAVQALSTQLAQRGLRLMLVSTPENDSTAEAVLAILQYQADAVVIASAVLTSSMAEACLRQGTPVVQFGRVALPIRAHAVVADNRGGAAAVAHHFAQTGRRRVAFVGGPHETSSARERSAGFSDACAREGLELMAKVFTEYSYAAGRAAVPCALRPTVPDAVFCASDLIALGFMDGLRTDLGLRVPQDVAIAGFDDVDAAAYAPYDLTTIRPDASGMAACAADSLAELIRQPGIAPRVVTVPVKLIARSSA